MRSLIRRRQFFRLGLLVVGGLAQGLADIIRQVVETSGANDHDPDESCYELLALEDNSELPQSVQIEDFLKRIDRSDDC